LIFFHHHVQRVGVAAECAFLDEVPVEGGQVEVGLVVLGVDVRLVVAVVEADGGERGAVLVQVRQLGAVGALFGPPAVRAWHPDVDHAVRGRHPPADVFQAFEGAEELRPECGCGLLVGVGLHGVVGVGGLRQRAEERFVVALDQFADLVLAEGVVVGPLVGGVCLRVEHDLVGGVVERGEAHHGVDGELAAGDLRE
jgi:hypothetical protein